MGEASESAAVASAVTGSVFRNPLGRVGATDSLSLAELLHRRHLVVEGVAKEYDLPPGEAEVLLSTLEWDEAQVTRSLADADTREELQEELHLSLYRRDDVPPFPEEDATSGMLMCQVCFDTIENRESAFALACGHWEVCRGCWREHLRTELATKDMSGLFTRCPMDGCDEVAGENAFRSLFSDEALEAWERAALADLKVHSNVAECPKECGNVVLFRSGERIVKCKCSHQFCPLCGKKPHAPLECFFRKAWRKRVKARISGKDGMSLDKELRGVVRVCPAPKCGRPIERVDGCDFIRCPCGVYFCWSCGRYSTSDTGVHHVYDCTDPPTKEWKKMLDSGAYFSDDGRFDWHFDRFMSYDDGYKISRKQVSALLKLATRKEAKEYYVADVSMIEKAGETLLRARVAQEWSSVYCFFLQNELEYKRFLATIAQLTKVADKLARIFDEYKTLEELLHQKRELVSLTTVVTNICEQIEGFTPEVAGAMADPKAVQAMVDKAENRSKGEAAATEAAAAGGGGKK